MRLIIIVVEFLVNLFNAFFDKGIYPENWTNSIIHPSHKKGDHNDPNNYRGISFSDSSGNSFSTVLYRRLQLWVKRICMILLENNKQV